MIEKSNRSSTSKSHARVWPYCPLVTQFCHLVQAQLLWNYVIALSTQFQLMNYRYTACVAGRVPCITLALIYPLHKRMMTKVSISCTRNRNAGVHSIFLLLLLLTILLRGFSLSYWLYVCVYSHTLCFNYNLSTAKWNLNWRINFRFEIFKPFFHKYKHTHSNLIYFQFIYSQD